MDIAIIVRLIQVKPMPKIIVALFVASVLVISGLLVADASIAQYIAVLISLLALVVSIVSAFKEDIFPFQPVVLLDEIILAPRVVLHTTVLLSCCRLPSLTKVMVLE